MQWVLFDMVGVHVVDDALQIIGRIDGDGLALNLDVVNVVTVLDEPENLDVLYRLDFGLAIFLAVIAIEFQGFRLKAVHTDLLVILHVDVALGEWSS